MRYSHLLTCVVAVALGAREAFSVEHGETSEFDGNNVRWQEIAKGVFTGVPQEKWNDSHHKRSNVELDIDEILAVKGFNDTSLDSRDLSIEGRDFPQQCKAGWNCVKYGGQWVLLSAYNVWISTAEYMADGNPRQDLFDFLNQPFIANAAGVAVAGIVSGQVNEATKKECSTSDSGNTQADIIRAAVEAAIAANPQAEEVSVDVTGPSGTVTIKIKAGPPNTTPATTC